MTKKLCLLAVTIAVMAILFPAGAAAQGAGPATIGSKPQLQSVITVSSVSAIPLLSLVANSSGTKSTDETAGIFLVEGGAGNTLVPFVVVSDSGTAQLPPSAFCRIYDAGVDLVNPVGQGLVTVGNQSTIVLSLASASTYGGVVVPANGTKVLLVTIDSNIFLSGTYGLTMEYVRYYDPSVPGLFWAPQTHVPALYYTYTGGVPTTTRTY